MAKNSILNAIPYLLAVPSKQMWMDYDDTADVLYIRVVPQ
jgi:hypothetical protein